MLRWLGYSVFAIIVLILIAHFAPQQTPAQRHAYAERECQARVHMHPGEEPTAQQWVDYGQCLYAMDN